MGQLINGNDYYQARLDAHGGIQLLLGDSLELMKAMATDSIDLVVTSPPLQP